MFRGGVVASLAALAGSSASHTSSAPQLVETSHQRTIPRRDDDDDGEPEISSTCWVAAVRQYGPTPQAASWTHVSRRQTRKPSARARHYCAVVIK